MDRITDYREPRGAAPDEGGPSCVLCLEAKHFFYPGTDKNCSACGDPVCEEHTHYCHECDEHGLCSKCCPLVDDLHLCRICERAFLDRQSSEALLNLSANNSGAIGECQKIIELASK